MARKKQPSTVQPLLLTIPQVATILGVCPATVYNLIYKEGLPTVRLRGAVRVHPESLQAWIKQQESA